MRLYFALGGSRKNVSQAFLNAKRPANVLIALPYWGGFSKCLGDFKWRGLAIDSGAFQVWNKGLKMSFEQYLTGVQKVLDSPFKPTEILALDVIGDWKEGEKNAYRMAELGHEVVPTYHMGEPGALLKRYAKNFPKIALGGMANALEKKKRHRFVDAAFAAVWPKKIHGLGMTEMELMLKYPWHSID